MVVAGPGAFDLNGLQLFASKVIINEMRLEGFSYDVPRPDYEPPKKEAAPKQRDQPAAVAQGPAPAGTQQDAQGEKPKQRRTRTRRRATGSWMCPRPSWT
jgi:hypothetical protein